MIKNERQVWSRSLETIRLFFSSEVRWTAIGWFALLLTLLVSLSGLNVVNSYVGRDFMTAISERRMSGFIRYAIIYAGVFAVSTFISSYYRFSEERLRLLWRGWLTRLLIDLYMSRDRFYRLKTRDEVDNPDERITEDVKSYTQTTLSFFLMSLNALITSLAFLGVLWSITPELVLVALLYAAVGSALTIFLGQRLVRLDNLQLQKEADLRYHLIQTRETAEAIATMGAGRTVRECIRARLNDVVTNNKTIIKVTRNLNFFVNGYNYLIQLIPLLIVAPMYIRGQVDFGVVTQSAMAFSAFLGAFSLIVTQFETLSSFAAVTNRLDTIAQAIEKERTPAASAVQIVEEEGRVAFEGLSLWSMHEHRPLVDGLSLSIPHGTNLLITGPDTTAETALFLATAGYWENGNGRIIRPGLDRISFVPKQPLTIRCTLRSHLVAVSAGRPFLDAEILPALEKVGLGAMVRRVGGLDADVHSPSTLSPAEERLLAFARVLLAAPRFVYIDRMGGELTREQVANLYGLFKESSITYLTVGDRHNLLAYHDRVLEVQGEGRWRTGLAQGPDAADGLATAPSVSDPTSTSTPSGAHE
jgi:vitamin B12/bleomycin/antimicrobial peptide transport system ATP-binding/permease protein